MTNEFPLGSEPDERYPLGLGHLGGATIDDFVRRNSDLENYLV